MKYMHNNKLVWDLTQKRYNLLAYEKNCAFCNFKQCSVSQPLVGDSQNGTKY